MKSSSYYEALRNGGTRELGMAIPGGGRAGGGLRPRSPSHAAKNKTPEDRVCEFGWMLTQKEGRLMCRACNLNLDHTRRSTIVEHLRSRKHQRFLEESDLDLVNADASTVSPMVLMEICDDENSQNNTQSTADRPPSRSSPASGMAGPYLLKKETHCATILDQLLRDDTFSDVTLTAEGQSIRAHKIVLCLASAYFRQVLNKESSIQNVIVFRDIKFSELKNLINFIYTGEATVDAADLDSFMRTADMLEVDSLCEGQRNFPKNLFPRGREVESEKPRASNVSSKRSHNTLSSSPPTKSRKIVETSSSLKLPRSSPCPSTSSDNSAPSIHVSTSVIKSEPPDDDVTLEPEFRGKDYSDAYVNPLESPSPYEDPSKSSPQSRDETPEKVPSSMCPFCLILPRAGASLTNHMHLCHPDKAVFPCDNCSRVFLKKGSFEAHIDDCIR